MTKITTEVIRERLRERVSELNKNPFKVARDAGLERSFISDLLKENPKKSFAVDKLPAIARALDCDVAFLVGEQDDPRSQQKDLPIAGIVEAGIYRLPMDEKKSRAPVAPDRRYSVDRQAVFSVNDDHAAGIMVLKGDYVTVLLTDEEDTPASEQLRPNDIVVAARDRDGKSEITIRCVSMVDGKIALSIPSSDPSIAADPFDKIVGRLIATKRVF